MELRWRVIVSELTDLSKRIKKNDQMKREMNKKMEEFMLSKNGIAIEDRSRKDSTVTFSKKFPKEIFFFS